MKLKYFLLLLPILSVSQNLIVSEILHKGNSITKDYIIEREIQHQIQMPLDSAVAIEDKNRLINLGIFADVQWRAIPLENMTIRLEYQIIENNKFLGGRFFGGPAPAYDEETGWSYGGGGVLKNFRGRNETVGGGLLLGGRNSFGFSYQNPWIAGDHISLNGDMAKSDFNHPYLPFRLKINTVELNIGRYFGYNRKTSIGFEIEDLDFISESDTINYKYFAPQGFFIYDTRDIYANPTKGLLIKQAFTARIDLQGKAQNNFTWFQSYSIYTRLSSTENQRPWILAVGAKSQINFGVKNQQFLATMGESGSVRGWHYPNSLNYEDPKQLYRFGFHNLKSSIELRKVLIPRFPMMNLYEFGVTSALFIDCGITTQGDFKDLFKMNPILGTGISLQLQMPFVSILRFDYGYGYYKGKKMDKAFHLAAVHQI
jgi:outer membrane protein assembly factor BamA